MTGVVHSPEFCPPSAMLWRTGYGGRVRCPPRANARLAFSNSPVQDANVDHFFNIPVYRVSAEEFEREREAWIKKELYSVPSVREGFAADPAFEGKTLNIYRDRYGVWRFNEIIGYICLHFCFAQIIGEWWRVDAKAVRKSRTKRFEYRGWKVVDEIDIPQGSTNQQIYELILEYLARAQKDKHLRRFYVDASVFECIGPHVDWNALLKKSNEPPMSGAS
jgi:hypothetical protein